MSKNRPIYLRPDYRPEWARPEPASHEAGELSLPEGPGDQPPWCPDRLAPPSP